MEKEAKEKWLKALRSGKYEQDTGQLCRNGRYCCLGVLAEELGILEAVQKDGYRYVKGRFATLPARTLASLGMSMENETTLIGLNDYGKSFREIADWVEENL